mmetsp:Transcript_21153/g.42677  ORF Transcript_21153/g.42677 Transcript_21153/m.42677 type:complete len:417 (-) Transcript_21153:423-1673(-)
MEWSLIPPGPEDAVFRVSRQYDECPSPDKVSLGIGAYRDHKGDPLVLSAVTAAKGQLASLPPQQWTHEYQPIGGNAEFLKAAQDLVFGKERAGRMREEGRLTGLQTMSGTGACRLGFEFVSRFGGNGGGDGAILLPDPTWANHRALAKFSRLRVLEYRYIDASKPETPRLDLEGMLEDLRAAPEGTTVVLHMCAHNPTGVDPTPEQWKKIAEVVQSNKLQPFFDNAYQGFASGDLDGDARSVRLFADLGLHPLVACSFAKNMGLYGERIGALHLVCPDGASAEASISQLKIEARAMYSNPPAFGAQVALRVMTEPRLRSDWEAELGEMSARIRSMREALRGRLEEMVPERTWHHVTDQIGMFSYTGLTKGQVGHCKEEGYVFMLDTGRISMAGLNEGNVERVARVMANAIKAFPAE